MKIAICDDDEFYREQILHLLEEYAQINGSINLSFSVFSNGAKLLETTEKVGGFDVYILDIVMPDMDGIELGIRLRKNGCNGHIIYLTSSAEFAVDSYKIKAFDYILKPIKKDVFFKAVKEVIAVTSEKVNNSIEVKTKENSVRISFDSILYAQMNRRAVTYYLANGETVESVMLRVPFAEAVAELLADKRFLHCGKTLVVNMHNITRVGMEEVIFKDSIQAFFSKNTCRDIRSQWSDYWFDGEVSE